MLSMRALKLGLAIISIIGGKAWAAYGELSLSVTESPPLNFDQKSQPDSFTSVASQLSVGEVKILSSLALTQIVQVARIDKYQYGFLDQSQRDLYAKNTHALVWNANTQLSYQRGQYTSSVAFLYPLSNNLLKQYGLSASQTVGFYNKSTVLGLNYQYLQEQRPRSYFLDFDFKVKLRPWRPHAHGLSLFYEQILTEKLRFRVKPFLIYRPEERPDALGGELLFAYAPLSAHALKLKGLYAGERKSQALKNERGYFKLLSVNAAWDYDLNYSTLLGLSYNYQREDEENSRNLTTRTLGLDTLSAAFEKKLSDFTVKLSANYAWSNLKNNFWGATLSLRREL